jgi:chromosome segregation ATPase
MRAAVMTSAHNATLAELAERHRTEYDSVHQDFELQLSSLQKYLQQRIDHKVSPIDAKIGKASAAIAKLREQIAGAAKHVDQEEELDIQKAQEMESERIRVLEQAIKEKNKQRLDELLQARQDLGECVRTLEELVAKNQTEMGNMAQRIETQRTKYEEKLRVGVENHNKRTDALRRRTQEAETKAKQSHTALRRLERHFNSELSKVTRENEQLKQDVANVATSEVSRRKNENEIQEADADLQKLRRDLQNREDFLANTREDSQTMKREIARINHEVAIKKRRAALKLI